MDCLFLPFLKKVTVTITIVYTWHVMCISQVLAQLIVLRQHLTQSPIAWVVYFLVMSYSPVITPVLAIPVVNDACVIPDSITQLHNNT